MPAHLSAVPWDLTVASGFSHGGGVLEAHLTDVNQEGSSWGRTACEHSPCCDLGSQKSIIHVTPHPGSGEDLQGFWLMTSCVTTLEEDGTWNPFGWVQIPLKKATISGLILKVPRPFLPKASHCRLGFPSSWHRISTTPLRLPWNMKTLLPQPPSHCSVSESRDIDIEPLLPLVSWAPFRAFSTQVGSAWNFDYLAENFRMSQCEAELELIKKRL